MKTWNLGSFGLGVEGLDFESISNELANQFKDLLYENKVLVIKRAHLSEENFLSLAKSWGSLIPFVDESFHHPTYPEIFVVSNRTDSEGKRIGMDKVGQYWHSDSSFLSRPQPLSLLLCRHASTSGGETAFVDMNLLWENIKDDLEISTLSAIHDGLGKYIVSEMDIGLSIDEIISRDRKICPPVVHPVVITHPKTGKQSLYVNPGFTKCLLDGNNATLDNLFQKIESSKDRYVHQWEPGDLVIWDNRSVVHQAYPSLDGEREMYRLGVRDGDFYVS
jgi:taurine dioxygenase